MRNLPSQGARAILAVLVISALSACVDEDAIYDESVLGTNPPTAAARFLGYADHDAQLTTCGNCHERLQAQWEATAHSHAWAAIEGLRPPDETCKTCHTVNERGNVVTEPAGYSSTMDERYEDVQCESCHGPGLTHALDPSQANAPLATLNEGLGATTGCGECHQGDDQPYLNEWAASRHGKINVFPAAQQGTCDRCHTGEGILAVWNVTGPYVEEGTFDGPGQHMTITCAVCHDPHGGPDHAQLRFPVGAPSVETNLCMQCHNERPNPDPVNEREPHAPEGPMLLGTAGWWGPSTPVGRYVGSHGDPVRNPRLCATCHMAGEEFSDYDGAGHTFLAIPCLDGQGRPDVSGGCADAERSFEGCTGAGCHGSAGSAQSARTAATARIQDLVDELRSLLDDVARSEFDTSDSAITVAEGARFNAQLAEKPGSVVHNPALLEALLLGSIRAVEIRYGLMASASVLRTPVFDVN